MNKKEIAELRRRVRPDRTNIQHIYGCYVNSQREIITRIDESLGLMDRDEQEKYVGLLKKSLSGGLGRNLMDLSFTTRQVMDGERHKLLSELRRTGLNDESLREQFFSCVVNNLDMGDTNYLVLIAYDTYDVPHFTKSGDVDEDAAEVFSYLICCVCPVKTAKPVLSFSGEENRFHNLSLTQIVAAPEIGFLFPAFDNRTANIYDALFYTKDTKGIHRDFIDAVFATEVPLSAKQQKEAFSAALSCSLEAECSLKVVQAVHGELRQRMEQHKESKDPEPLTVTPEDVAEVLEQSGIGEDEKKAFLTSVKEGFGEHGSLSPENIVSTGKFEIESENIKVKINPDLAGLVKTETIDGKKYILIPAEAGVEVNGIPIRV